MKRTTRCSTIGAILVASLALAAPVFAGPPLLCFPFETGGAKTLPMKGGDWKSVDPKYDVSHLTADTLALLTPATPVVARMETIRRATIYASTHPQIAGELLASLQSRAAMKTADAGQAVPKNEFSRFTVLSMNWSGNTKRPGRSSSCNEPTAESEKRSVTPQRFSTSILAR